MITFDCYLKAEHMKLYSEKKVNTNDNWNHSGTIICTWLVWLIVLIIIVFYYKHVVAQAYNLINHDS